MQDNKWARLLAYVTGRVNQRLLLQNEYLSSENLTLTAVHLTPPTIHAGFRGPITLETQTSGRSISSLFQARRASVS
jgi:hypothetical protein